MDTCSCWKPHEIAIATLVWLVNLAIWVEYGRLRKNNIKRALGDLDVQSGRSRIEAITNRLIGAKERAALISNRVSVNLSKVQPIVPSLKQTTPTIRARAPTDWEIKPSEIKLGEKIAAGSFGEVYKGEWFGMTVAIKKPSKDIPQNVFDKFFDEVDLMTKLHHPNIVVFLGGCLNPGNLFLVMEYLDNGCLYDFLRSKESESILTFTKVLKFAVDIARGMRYLHSRCQIIQRDLKSRNLLLDESYNVKICDFGLSRYAETDGTMTACGTPYWAAPEVILGQVYDSKADVYSFAIVLWELITRDEPYEGKPGLDIAFGVAQHGLRPPVPAFATDGYIDLMTTCWDHDPKKRPNFDTILERLQKMSREAKAFNSFK